MTMTNNELAVTQLYIAAYGRDPDAAGLAYWSGQLDKGTSLSQLASNFGTAPEFHALYDGKTPEQVLTILYQNDLGRVPDAAGLAAYLHTGAGPTALLAAFASPSNTEGIIHNAQTIAKIDDAVTNHTSFPTGAVDNGPIIIEHEVIKEVPGPTVTVTVPGPTVYVPTPTEPTHNVTSSADATLDSSSMKAGTTEFVTGGGIPGTHSSVVLDHTSGVELGLHVQYRTGDSVTGTVGADGFAHYALDKGIQNGTHSEAGTNVNRSGATFDWSVNTGLSNLADHTFVLKIDTDPTAGTSYQTFNPVADFPDNAGNAHLAQNAVNYGFSFLSSHIAGVGPAGSGDIPAGHYDVQLVEMVGTTAVAANHIVIDLT